MTGTLTADDISLTQTCSACPEQYDAYAPDGRQVGYLRLRHGYFSVSMPDAGGAEVYHANPQGDGVFDPGERDEYLREARQTIATYLNAAGGSDPPATPLAIAAALQQAAISEWDASDGKVIEIYVSQIAPIVARILKGDQ